MDLRERRQLDVSASVAKVRAKARPWRSIFALLIAIAGAIAAEVSGVQGWADLRSAASLPDETHRILFISGQAAFLVFGLAAAVGLSGLVRWRSQQLIGQAHAGVLRYVLVLAGVFAVITISLAIARIDVKQLLVSGAVVGVLLGIAAQQSLANLFAGLVLLFARPFRVGDHVRFRAGALSGQVEGIIIDISLTYVRLQTDEGPVLLPNSQALAAAVLLLPDHEPADLTDVPDRAGVSQGVTGPSAPATTTGSTGPSVIPGNTGPGTAPGGTAPGGTADLGEAGWAWPARDPWAAGRRAHGPGLRYCQLVVSLVLGDHAGRNPPTLADIHAALLRPGTYIGTALPMCGGTTLRLPDPGRDFAGLIREPAKHLVKFLTVLLA